MNAKKIKIGISACLLGQTVRYNGEHKRNAYIVEELAKIVDFIPICPEVEAGLSIPREPMLLTGPPETPRLITRDSAQDKTEQLENCFIRHFTLLEKEGIAGFIFKSKSPSCGLQGVPVKENPGKINPQGIGLFARAFKDHFPLLPVAEETNLNAFTPLIVTMKGV